MDEMNRLMKYANGIKDRMESSLPAKHKNREESYRRFLKNEYDAIMAKVEVLRFSQVKKS